VTCNELLEKGQSPWPVLRDWSLAPPGRQTCDQYEPSGVARTCQCNPLSSLVTRESLMNPASRRLRTSLQAARKLADWSIPIHPRPAVYGVLSRSECDRFGQTSVVCILNDARNHVFHRCRDLCGGGRLFRWTWTRQEPDHLALPQFEHATCSQRRDPAHRFTVLLAKIPRHGYDGLVLF
jgi:hypothetical protein